MTQFTHARPSQRHIALDIAQARHRLDRFFDHCVDADYAGTLIREDWLAQLGTA